MFEYRIALFEFEYKCISLFVCLNIASSALRFARSASPWIDLPHFQKRRGRDLSMKLIAVNTHRRRVLTRIWGFPLEQLTWIDQLTSSSNISRLRADILITAPRAWQENKIGDLCRPIFSQFCPHSRTIKLILGVSDQSTEAMQNTFRNVTETWNVPLLMERGNIWKVF